MATMTDTYLTSAEVCERTGLTYRRLDYWCRIGLITPVVEGRGQGSLRQWPMNIVGEIDAMLHRIEQCPFPHV